MCAVSMAGASIGIAYSDRGEEALRVGYLAAITFAVVGLGAALLLAEQRRRFIGLALVNAERALGRLTARRSSDVRSAILMVFDLLREVERWSGSPEAYDLQEELARRIRFAGLHAEEEDIVILRWAISALLSAGAVDEAEQITSPFPHFLTVISPPTDRVAW